MVVVVACIGQQFISHPKQAQTTDQHEAGNLQEPNHANGHDATHSDGTSCAPEDRFLLQIRGQAARRQSDHDGVVTRQHKVNQDEIGRAHV